MKAVKISRLLCTMLLILSCIIFGGCGSSHPDESDVIDTIMNNYNCTSEPELLDSYSEEDDTYYYEYAIAYETPDRNLIVEVSVGLEYYYDSGEWYLGYFDEVDEPYIYLNRDQLIGTWTGKGLVSTIDDAKIDVTLEITDVDEDTVSYNIEVVVPETNYEYSYDKSGTFTVNRETSLDDYYDYEVYTFISDTPLLYETHYNWLLGTVTSGYYFKINSYRNEYGNQSTADMGVMLEPEESWDEEIVFLTKEE